ncbi:MAG: hypothetical protein KBD46_01490 [Candidatus Levybacteria bacterium]|nr:hypothetical protein [Candidatus Levybacteria bacterium]
MSTRDYALRHKTLGLCRNCPKPVVQGNTLYCEYHKEKDRISRSISEKKIAIALKALCLKQYGDKCRCCEESIIQFLTIEHVEGNGNNHRKELFKHNVGGVHMYRWLKKNNFPKGYAILCMNCNWATRYRGICPHELLRRGG